MEERIIGGSVVNQTRYPYFTQLLIFLTSGDILTCGGTLIAPDVVLSAAHCLTGFAFPVSRVTAFVNATKRATSMYKYKRDVVDIVLHPDYNFSKSTRRNDVAVLKLKENVTGVPYVKINKNPARPIADGARVTTIGLGKNNSDLSSNPDFLLEVSIKTVSFATCSKYYTAIANDIMICAGGLSGPCGGDSGGPLTVLGTTAGNDVQVGITSFRPTALCGTTEAPLGFTRVSYYADWIDMQVCRVSSSKLPAACAGMTAKPTGAPTTILPSVKPTTVKPSPKPVTVKPSVKPTVKPSAKPTLKPTLKPTVKPTVKPSKKPTLKPSKKPTLKPSAKPTVKPTAKPSIKPTVKPSIKPTLKPSIKPQSSH